MRQPVYYSQPKRSRPWLIALPLLGFVLIAFGWSVFWFFASTRVEPAIDGWRAREAKAGRIHTCAQQEVGGFPFRIEVSCTSPTTEFQAGSTPGISTTTRGYVIGAKALSVVGQVYDPRHLVAEVTAPMTFGEKGQPATVRANWALAQVSVRGTPQAPERVSVVIDKAELANFNRGTMELFATAARAELHGRIASGSVNENPAVELVVRTTAALAPSILPLLAQPTDTDFNAVLTGLKDFAPKPWSDRFREIAASNGRIEVKQARLSQGEILAVGSGSLSVNQNGKLDGQLTLTVAGLEKLISALGVDQMVSQYLGQRGGANTDKIASGLDRIIPGLGGAVRNNAGSIAAAGVSMLGQPTELEGKKATSLPLKLTDGAIYLGPILVGQTPALF